jgi:hypothetical protein
MRSEFRLLAAIGTVMALVGCGLTERTTVEQSAVVQWPTDNDSLDYWDTLESQAVTTNDDALHGLLLLVQESPPPADWNERLAAAQRRGWLRTGTSLQPTESAQIGMIAVCICHILDVQGGLSMRIAGKIPRYSTRELVHMGLLPGITENEALTGSEFLALIAATEQQQWLDMAFAAREEASATVKTAPQPSKEAVEAENLPIAPPADQADTPVPTPVATDNHEVAP